MTYLEFRKRFIVPLHTFYVVFRKRYLLPIKYFFTDAKLMSEIEYPEKSLLVERIAKLQKKLISAIKRDQRIDARVIEAQIKELEWVAYGKS